MKGQINFASYLMKFTKIDIIVFLIASGIFSFPVLSLFFNSGPLPLSSDTMLAQTGTVSATYHDPYGAGVMANSYDAQFGTQLGGTLNDVGWLTGGDWLEYKSLDFGTIGATTFDLLLSVDPSHVGNKIEIRLDGTTGTKIGEITTQSTGSYSIFKDTIIPVTATTGIHDVYLVMVGSDGIGSIRSFVFSPPVLWNAPFPVQARDAYGVIEAETTDAVRSVVVRDGVVGYFDDGDWVLYKNVNFGTVGASSFDTRMSTVLGGHDIEIHLDSVSGTLAGVLHTTSTGGWGVNLEESVAVSPITGIHDVYLVGRGGEGIANIDWFKFIQASHTTTPPPSPTPTSVPALPPVVNVLANTVASGAMTSIAGKYYYFSITVPSGASNLQINTAGAGDADLYIKSGSQPINTGSNACYWNAVDYGWKSNANGSNESVTITTPTATVYYITIAACGSLSNVTVTAAYTAPAPTQTVTPTPVSPPASTPVSVLPPPPASTPPPVSSPTPIPVSDPTPSPTAVSAPVSAAPAPLPISVSFSVAPRTQYVYCDKGYSETEVVFSTVPESSAEFFVQSTNGINETLLPGTHRMQNGAYHWVGDVRNTFGYTRLAPYEGNFTLNAPQCKTAATTAVSPADQPPPVTSGPVKSPSVISPVAPVGTAISLAQNSISAPTKQPKIPVLWSDALSSCSSAEACRQICTNLYCEQFARNKVSPVAASSSETSTEVGPVILSERVGVRAFLDTDSDGLSDYDELNIYHTNPDIKDTNKDGIIDGGEIMRWTGSLLKTGEVTTIPLISTQDPRNSGVTSPRFLSVENVAPLPPQENTATSTKILRFSGHAPANSFITLYIFSLPIVVVVKTDDSGAWSYILDKELPDGTHEVYGAIADISGKIMAKSEPLPFTKEAQAITISANGVPLQQSELDPSFFGGVPAYVLVLILALLLGFAFALIGFIVRKDGDPQPPLGSA